MADQWAKISTSMQHKFKLFSSTSITMYLLSCLPHRWRGEDYFLPPMPRLPIELTLVQLHLFEGPELRTLYRLGYSGRSNLSSNFKFSYRPFMFSLPKNPFENCLRLRAWKFFCLTGEEGSVSAHPKTGYEATVWGLKPFFLRVQTI